MLQQGQRNLSKSLVFRDHDDPRFLITIGGSRPPTKFSIAQKYVVAVVLVPLSHVIVTVQFRNRGTAGTILMS